MRSHKGKYSGRNLTSRNHLISVGLNRSQDGRLLNWETADGNGTEVMDDEGRSIEGSIAVRAGGRRLTVYSRLEETARPRSS